MELNEFIRDVIVNIYEGVDMAKKSTGKKVIPISGTITPSSPKSFKDISDDVVKVVSDIEFEVSLIESEKSDKSKVIGVMLQAIKGGFSNNKENSETSTSKIKFNIPIALE